MEARRKRTENARKVRAENVKKLRLEAAAAELRAAHWVVVDWNERERIAELIEELIINADPEFSVESHAHGTSLADLLGIRIGKALA